MRSNQLLNLAKKRPSTPSSSFSVCCLSIIAQSAGVSVRATKAERQTETAIVRANCL